MCGRRCRRRCAAAEAIRWQRVILSLALPADGDCDGSAVPVLMGRAILAALAGPLGRALSIRPADAFRYE